MPPFLLKAGSTVLLIGGLVFIHELGHFLMAKLFNVRVLRFSIGFGPKLLGFTHGETEYWIAPFPFGGYVKMAGEQFDRDSETESDGRGLFEQVPWKRGLIYLAGPAMSLAFPVALYFAVFFFQDQTFSTRAGSVDPDSPAWNAGIRAGDRLVEIDGKPVRYFLEVRELVAPKWEQKVHVIVERRDGSRFEADVTPRKVMEQDLLSEKPRGVLGIAARQTASVIDVTSPDSPAARAGLRPLDRLLQLDGKPLASWQDVEQRVLTSAEPMELEVLRLEATATPGAPLQAPTTFHARLVPELRDGHPWTGLGSADTVVAEVARNSPAEATGLQRGDRLLEADGKPLLAWSTLERIRAEAKTRPIPLVFTRNGERHEVQLTQRELTRKNDAGKEVPLLYFGAAPDPSDLPGEQIPLHYGVARSLELAAKVVPETIGAVMTVLWGLFTAEVAFETVGGPGMLADLAVKSAEAGWDAYLSAMAAISINLGITNLLPIPALDGFAILSALFEWVRRRPLSERAREIANGVGLLMVLTLMAFVLKNDIVRYVMN